MKAAREAELVDRLVLLLREERLRKGWSMEQLAAASRVHRTAIGLIERRQRRMTVDVAARIAWALGLSLGEVLRTAEEEVHKN